MQGADFYEPFPHKEGGLLPLRQISPLATALPILLNHHANCSESRTPVLQALVDCIQFIGLKGLELIVVIKETKTIKFR